MSRKPPQSGLIHRREALRTLGLGAGILALSGPIGLSAARQKSREKLDVGTFTQIYDPSSGENDRWYINDHTFIRADDGVWHLFGITHREPANAPEEKFFAHATAPDLFGPWTKRPFVLNVDEAEGERVVWAPYVLRHAGLYWMYYCAGGTAHSRYRIHLALSPDLFHWKRHAENPMVIDGYDARDPMVFRHGADWFLYYAATSAPAGGYHTVKAVSSHDLVHWSNTTEVFRSDEKGTYGGPTESPFVVERDAHYYLFVCTNHGYNETAVYASETPIHWRQEDLVGKFPAHAAEVIHTSDDRWYVSRAGWGQGGVFLAQLQWR
jgi:sucrose-6-phosphate hydrolase SacC (GH32 family)